MEKRIYRAMTTKKFSSLSACRFVAFSIFLLASNASSARYVLGSGTQLCENWNKAAIATKDKENPAAGWDALLLNAWVIGYLSGANALVTNGSDILLNVDGDLITAYVAGYCQKNPQRNVYDATDDLLIKLLRNEERRLQKK